MHIFGDSLMRRIDEIILRNKPENWNLTIQFEEKGMEVLEYKYPDDKDYDHVIYCSAGNGMYKPFGKPAWTKLEKNIKLLGKQEPRKVNVILVGTDEIWLRKLKARPKNEVFFYRNEETSRPELHTV